MAISTENLLNAAVMQGLLDAHALEKLRFEAKKMRSDLLEDVLAFCRFPLSVLYRALATQYQMDFIYPLSFPVALDSLKKLPRALVRRRQVLPLVLNGEVVLATADPEDRATLDNVKRLLNIPVRIALSEPAALEMAIDRAFPEEYSANQDGDSVALLDDILKAAYLRHASDVHILPDESGMRVRLRADGVMQDYISPMAIGVAQTSIVSRIKVLARLDISEQREAQDGGFSYHLTAPIDQDYNIRVATAPVRLGERITMRLLAGAQKKITLHEIGMSDHDLSMFRKVIRKPYGIVLLTGPTGSGKSTTLYAALQEINTPEVNIMTVENPIEYVMEGVSQIQTSVKISFAEALRSFLRHDPDVLMVGEIRDEETADIALKAAMTGHLVFSTLHTNTSCGAVVRLVDIGCEPFLIGATLSAVIGQRLVRRLCPRCCQSRTTSMEERALLDSDDAEIFDAVGCASCQGTGYRGRVGLFETLWMDEVLLKLVSRGCTEEALEALAISRNRFVSMWEDGARKVLSGQTTLEELQLVAVKREVSLSPSELKG